MGRTVRRLGLGLLLFTLAGCGQLGGPATSEHPIVIVYMLDAARADYFSSYGHPYPTTPEMDAMAAEGVRFARHYSHAHVTAVSVPQLFTARLDAPPLMIYPPGWEMPWWNRDEVPMDDMVFLPHLLSEAGYDTRMVTTHPWTTAESRFSRGFEHFYDVPRTSYYAPAEDVFARAREAIDAYRAEGLERPLFLYIHLLDTHTPHDGTPPVNKFFSLDELGWTPEQWRQNQPGIRNRRYIKDPDPKLIEAYEGAVRSSLYYTDLHLGRFKRYVEERIDAPTTHVITADHGDALGENGYFEHILPTFGTDATHHIPLIMSGPGLTPGAVVDRLTGMVDVMPTLLDLLEVDLPSSKVLDGRSMTRVIDEPRSRWREIVPYVHRLGWTRSRLGFRGEASSVVMTADGELFQNDGGFDFRPLGRLEPEGSRSSTTPDGEELSRESVPPQAFWDFVDRYQGRMARRPTMPLARSMIVPLPELRIRPVVTEPMQPESSTCWTAGPWRERRRALTLRALKPGARCEPLTVGFSVPLGGYAVHWKVNRFEGKGRLRITLPGSEPIEFGPADATGGELSLGRALAPTGNLELKVEVLGVPEHLALGSLRLEREGSLQPEEVQEVDPETIEQLRSLGYLDG
ncbi:MAG: sulfatase [Acidobacteriota bacterium]